MNDVGAQTPHGPRTEVAFDVEIEVDAVMAPDMAPGLRSRKKAKRRDEIIAAAKDLFATNGIDTTTMAEIAERAGISVPTVFNYFGSKDGVLIALICEGTAEARAKDQHLHWSENTDLGTLILNLFLRVSRRTLEVASKRVWRYAESATIRRPETEFSAQYAGVSATLISVIAEFFDSLDLGTRSGKPPSSTYLAKLFYDVWIPCFIDLITNENEGLDAHEAILRTRLLPLVDLVFDEATIATPRRKGPSA